MKRKGSALALAAFASLAMQVQPSSAIAAEAKEPVNVAVVVPLSGRFARQGQLILAGAKVAVDEVNKQGGIAALGGAKLELRVADAGDSVEKAVSAAHRTLTVGNAVSAGMGAWVSSFTLGVTEVAERAGIPWFTVSFADSITERGFRFTFQSSPVSSEQARRGLELVMKLAEENGHKITKVALVGDNLAHITSFFAPLRKLVQQKNIQLVVDEIWAPPLADATPIVSKLRSKKPDVIFYGATSFPDSLQILQKMKEYKVQIPIIGAGAWLALPEYLNSVGKDKIDQVMVITGANPLKGQEDLTRRLKEATKEPFVTQDTMMAYAHVWTIKQALELARSADPKAVADAARKLNITTGQAAALWLPHRVAYDEKGRRRDAMPVIAQWQDGQPYTIAPAEYATRKGIWRSK